jgi:hypothetical protein
MSQFNLSVGSVSVQELAELDLSVEELMGIADAIAPIVDDVEDPFGNFDALVAARPYLSEDAE